MEFIVDINLIIDGILTGLKIMNLYFYLLLCFPAYNKH